MGASCRIPRSGIIASGMRGLFDLTQIAFNELHRKVPPYSYTTALELGDRIPNIRALLRAVIQVSYERALYIAESGQAVSGQTK